MAKEKRDDDPGDGPDYCVVLETDSGSYHNTSIIEKDLSFEAAEKLRDSVSRSYNGQERRIRKTPKRDWEV